MTFSKQDALTFAIGLGVALGIELGAALGNLSADSIGDKQFWTSIGVGLLSALGRYVATRLPELLRRPAP